MRSTCATRDGSGSTALNGPALKPIHDWVSQYERAWSERFDELDAVLEELKQKEESDGSDGDASRG